MENQDRGGMEMPSPAREAHAGNDTHASQKQRLTGEAPQNLAPDLPLLKYIADQERKEGLNLAEKVCADLEPGTTSILDQNASGPDATLPEGVRGEIVPVQPVVDCHGFLPNVFLNDQPRPFYEHINALVRNIMRPANTIDILPLIPDPLPPQARRPRIVGDWPALLSREQLCEYLAISPSSLPQVCPVQPVDLGVNVLRWRRAEIDRWLATLLPRPVVSKGKAEPAPAGLPEAMGISPDERRASALDRVRKGVRATQ